MNKYAIIDIETTGGSAHREKIIEIAIAIFDGEKVIDEYETLINPERSIPPFITKLTGIDNHMVKEAPKFYEVAKDIVELTENMIFVAHNVRFDYSFVQEEFKRLGFNYSRKQLCTVRMSRRSFPGLRSYSLGNLIKHFNIEVNARHRAMADVMATIEVFKNILGSSEEDGGANLMIKNYLKNVKLPEKIQHEEIMALPERTGVYYFIDKYGRIIYIGKSINIRKRVKQHFQGINPKSNKLYQQAVSVRYEITGSELIAFLLESEEIKKYQPDVNRASRTKAFPYFIHHYTGPEGYRIFEIGKNTIRNRANKQILTEHSNHYAARAHLKRLQTEFELCGKHTGLSKGDGPCFEYGIQLCNGACVLEENPDDYNKRANFAARFMDKIAPQNLFLIDEGRNNEETSVTLVKEGMFYGYSYFDKNDSFDNPSKIEEMIVQRKYYPEQNTIIRRFIHSPGKIKVIEFEIE